MPFLRPTPTILLLLVPWFAPAPGGPAPAASPADDVEWGPWYELRPLDHPSGSASVAEPHEPERELRSLRANEDGPNLEREFAAKGPGRPTTTWKKCEFAATEESPLGDQVKIDFTRGLEPARSDNAVAFLYRTIDTAVAQNVWVLLGSDDGMRMWLNGELVADMPVARGVKEAENKLALSLPAGRSHLLVKVGNGGGAWGFQLIHDEERIIELRMRAEQAINNAIDRGVDFLSSTQYPDGSWHFMTNEYRNGQTALAVYTLLKSGVPLGNDAVQRGIRYLRSRPPAKTYSAALQLMAFEAAKDPSLHPDMEAIAELLFDWQMGGYAYPHGGVDLSNTQYGALGLRAAHHAGLRVRPKVWSDLAEHVLGYQQKDGGFAYNPGGGNPTGSMTAAGLTVLGCCHEILLEEGDAGGKLKRVERAMREGMEWLDRNWSVRNNPRGPDRWGPYYLYGLERVGAFLRTPQVGAHDWYWDGAQHLLGIQGKDGQWSTAYGESEPNTCFALLFLERATATVSGAGQRSRSRSYGTDDKAVAVSLRASGDTPLTVWVSSFGDAVTADHSWPMNQGGGLRVKRVEYTVGGEVVETVAGDPTSPSGLERYPVRIRFPRIGEYTVAARVVLTTAPPETREVILEAGDLAVTISDMVNEETISYASDSTRNLLTEARFDTSASSQFNNHPPHLATDDRLSTCWLSANEEGIQSWTLELKRPVRADALLLSQAWPNPREPNHCARFTKIEVVINKRKKNAIVVDTSTSMKEKTRIPFGKPEAVRHLEIRVLAHTPGEQQPHAVGFSEVELQLGKGK